MIGRAEARAFLADKPVGLLWGVGAAMQRRLAQDGITQIGEFARLDEATLTARYGKIGSRLHYFARGEDETGRSIPSARPRASPPKITLDEDLSDLEKLRADPLGGLPRRWRGG